MSICRSETDVMDITTTPPKPVQFLFHKDSAQFIFLGSSVLYVSGNFLLVPYTIAYVLLWCTLVCASLRTRAGNWRRQAMISPLVGEEHPTSSARTAAWVWALLLVIMDAGEKAEPPWKKKTISVTTSSQNTWSPGEGKKDEEQNLLSCRMQNTGI